MVVVGVLCIFFFFSSSSKRYGCRPMLTRVGCQYNSWFQRLLDTWSAFEVGGCSCSWWIFCIPWEYDHLEGDSNKKSWFPISGNGIMQIGRSSAVDDVGWSIDWGSIDTIPTFRCDISRQLLQIKEHRSIDFGPHLIGGEVVLILNQSLGLGVPGGLYHRSMMMKSVCVATLKLIAHINSF